MKRFSLLCALAGILFYCSCDDAPTQPQADSGTGSPPEVEADSATRREALLISHLLTGELRSPEKLRQRVCYDLVSIREEFDTVPETNIRYVSNVYEDRIAITFYPIPFGEVVSGNYHHWDSLNTQLGLDSFTVPYTFIDRIHLHFSDTLNTRRLVEIYSEAGFPGMWYLSNWKFLTDGDRLLVQMSGDTVRYFFRDGFGDCPAGCIYSYVAAFESDGNTITYLGLYRTTFDPVQPPWWQDVISAYQDWYDQGVLIYPDSLQAPVYRTAPNDLKAW